MRRLVQFVCIPALSLILFSSHAGGEVKRAKDVRNLNLITVEKGTLLFSPRVVLVKPGTTITWSNQDDRDHFLMLSPATSSQASMTEEPPFNEALPPGALIKHKITHVGIYPFFCAIHNQMWGMVMVDEQVGGSK